MRTGRPLRLSITTEGALYPPGQVHRFLEIARVADALGVDQIDINEHVLTGVNAAEQDPFRGWNQANLDMMLPEPLALLAGMMGATRQTRFATSILIAPLWPAGLLAKIGATLHALSQGRFVLGVSTGWLKDEFDALGVPFASRGQILEDSIGACRALWDRAPADFQSATVSFTGMYCQPRPLPGERIPVWFGGKFTPRLVRRIVELGDGWVPYSAYGMSLDQCATCVDQIQMAWSAAGRDPASFDVALGVRVIDDDLARSLEQVPLMAEAGINVIRVNLRRFTPDPEHAAATIAEITRRFAEYRSLTA